MDKVNALQTIQSYWDNKDASFAEKVVNISESFYSAGLDLSTTAAFIKATPSELDALLSLGELDDEAIELLSNLDPPKTTWAILSNASEKELNEAIKVLSEKKDNNWDTDHAISEYIFNRMRAVSEPTVESKISMIPGGVLMHFKSKGEDFKAINKWTRDFLNSIYFQKKKGKELSEKQINALINILNELADRGVIKRNSIDGDQNECDLVLDALGR